MKAISLGIQPSKKTIAFGAALACWVLGIILAHFSPVSIMLALEKAKVLPFLLFLASWLLAGFSVLKNAAENFLPRKGKTLGSPLDENFLMSAATIGAFAIGEWAEAAAVMLFYKIGELIQEAAISRSRSSINALLALKPDKARVQNGND